MSIRSFNLDVEAYVEMLSVLHTDRGSGQYDVQPSSEGTIL